MCLESDCDTVRADMPVDMLDGRMDKWWVEIRSVCFGRSVLGDAVCVRLLCAEGVRMMYEVEGEMKG